MQIPKFNQTWQQIDNRSGLKRLKRSDDNLKLPESFEVGQAIADGNCFFDSFRQGLEQQLHFEPVLDKQKNIDSKGNELKKPKISSTFTKCS